MFRTDLGFRAQYLGLGLLVSGCKVGLLLGSLLVKILGLL